MVLVLRTVNPKGSLPRAPCEADGRPWLWRRCSFARPFNRVLPLNHGDIVWVQEVCHPCHHHTTRRDCADCTSLQASELSAGFPEGRAQSLGGKSFFPCPPIPVGLPGTENRHFFSIYDCGDAFQERELISLPPLPFVYNISFLINHDYF